MKIPELIDYLKTQDQTLDVMVPGYEDGFSDVTIELISVEPIARDVLNASYYGPHIYPYYREWNDDDEPLELLPNAEGKEIYPALILHRNGSCNTDSMKDI